MAYESKINLLFPQEQINKYHNITYIYHYWMDDNLKTNSCFLKLRE